MKTLLSLLLVFCALNLHAQQAFTKVIPYRATMVVKNPTVKYIDSMPNALLNYRQQQFKIGNNGGFDVYKDRFDNMSVLKPDQTFASNMPVLQTTMKMTPKYMVLGDTAAIQQLQESYRASPTYKPKTFGPR